MPLNDNGSGRLYGQGTDAQMLESLGVFSMVDTSQRDAFIKDTETRLSESYKNLHDQQMSFINEELKERTKFEKDLIEIQLGAHKTILESYGKQHDERMRQIQQELDLLNKYFENEDKQQQQKNDSRSEEQKLREKFLKDYFDKSKNQYDKLTKYQKKKAAEAAKSAGEKLKQAYKDAMGPAFNEADFNLEDVSNALKKAQSEAYEDTANTLIDAGKKVSTLITNAITKGVNDYLIPYMGLNSFGKASWSQSLAQGNSSFYDFRHQYGQYGLDNVQTMTDAMVESQAKLSERGLVVGPETYTKMINILQASYGVAGRSQEELAEILSVSVKVQEGIGKINLDSDLAKWAKHLQGTDAWESISNAIGRVAAGGASEQWLNEFLFNTQFGKDFVNDSMMVASGKELEQIIVDGLSEGWAGSAGGSMMAQDRAQVYTNAYDTKKGYGAIIGAPLFGQAKSPEGMRIVDERSQAIYGTVASVPPEKNSTWLRMILGDEYNNTAVRGFIYDSVKDVYDENFKALDKVPDIESYTEADKANAKTQMDAFKNSSKKAGTGWETVGLIYDRIDEIAKFLGVSDLIGSGLGSLIGNISGSVLNKSLFGKKAPGSVPPGGMLASLGSKIGPAIGTALPWAAGIAAVGTAIGVAVVNWEEGKKSGLAADDEVEDATLESIRTMAKTGEETFIGMQQNVTYDANHNPVIKMLEYSVEAYEHLTEEEKLKLKEEYGILNEEQYLQHHEEELQKKNSESAIALIKDLKDETNVFTHDYWHNDEGKFDGWAILTLLGDIIGSPAIATNKAISYSTGTDYNSLIEKLEKGEITPEIALAIASGQFTSTKSLADSVSTGSQNSNLVDTNYKYKKYYDFVSKYPDSKSEELISMYTELGLLKDDSTRNKFFQNFDKYYFDYYTESHEKKPDGERYITNIEYGSRDPSNQYIGSEGYPLATGISAVPYNGYKATLHQGEMVLPSKKANYIRSLFGQKPVPYSGVPETQLTGNNSFVQSLPDYKQTPNIDVSGEAHLAAGDDAVAYAASFVGKARYSQDHDKRYGPNYFDCSGLVSKSYESVGLGKLGSCATIINEWPDLGFNKIYWAPGKTQGIGRDDIESPMLPGDVVLYNYNTSNNEDRTLGVDHVGIATGSGLEMIDASSGKDSVVRRNIYNSGKQGHKPIVAILRYGSGGDFTVSGEGSQAALDYIFNGNVPSFVDPSNPAYASLISPTFNGNHNFRMITSFLGASGGGGNGFSGISKPLSLDSTGGYSSYDPVKFNGKALEDLEASDFNGIIQKYASAINVNPLLMYGMMMTESSGNPLANKDNTHTYKGLMQIDQDKVNEYLGPNYDIYDPDVNMYVASEYLKHCIQKIGYVSLGIGGYNTGPNREGWKTAARTLDTGANFEQLLQTVTDLGHDDSNQMKTNPYGIKTSYIRSVYNYAGLPLDIPYLANGGIVSSPTIAMIGEGDNSEAVTPLDRSNNLLGIDSMTEKLLDGLDDVCGHLIRKLDQVIEAIKSINVGVTEMDIQVAKSRSSRQLRNMNGYTG